MVCLLISCFAGCNQTAIPAPSDAPIASVETTDAVESAVYTGLQEEIPEPQQSTVSQKEDHSMVTEEIPRKPNDKEQSSVSKKETEKQNNKESSSVFNKETFPKKENKSPVSSTVSNIPNQSDKQQDGNPTELPTYNPLTFTSVSQLEIFFQQGVAQNKEQEAALQTFHAQQNRYLRPIAVKEWKLQEIVAETSGMTYRYNFPVNKNDLQKEECDLKITVNYDDNESYNKLFDHIESNKSGVQLTVDNIEYVYAPHVNNDGITIVWKQFGITHAASLYSHTDQIETILPLLKIERVSLNTTDLVTQ